MGSEDSIPRKQACQQIQITYKLKILLLIVVTNLLTIYIFTTPHSNFDHPLSRISQLPFWDTKPLLLKLNSTQDQLTASHSQIADLQTQLKSARELLGTLLDRLNRETISQAVQDPSKTFEDMINDIPVLEAKLAIGPHTLPLGNTPWIGSEVYASIGGGCLKHKQDLARYMSYDVGGECPSDDIFAQTLMLKGCEPLPRRRCHPRPPPNYPEPQPLPGSLWATPPDTSIVWDPYTCKNYTCLIERKKFPGSYDCKDCFDLEGREKTRWVSDNGGLDFGMDQVLAAKPPGAVRIGLDIGGGSGTFAARMKERNVTIITTSMNFDGPFNSFIASRGLIPMHVSISQRFPFFENTLDIVHSMHVLSNWIPDAMLEFALYDIYRVLRPGGLFWLDRFFCFGAQLNATYVPMFERVGFRRLRWNTGMKLDRGIQKNEWYFSALLEKPMA
ncbi:probable methyltransferase At1g29790 [Salvia miltiorrhiza]|uniref:probable methyltransferase At1g29790 n=1 Tax=Salvia miltiorrhiza TaxID=226208 RepID=UPI0025AD95E1|nr:probable methyltransferase At1g29790 [Salvia miltiorrhiza]